MALDLHGSGLNRQSLPSGPCYTAAFHMSVVAERLLARLSRGWGCLVREGEQRRAAWPQLPLLNSSLVRSHLCLSRLGH